MFAKYKIDVREIQSLKRTFEDQYQMQIPELDFETKTPFPVSSDIHQTSGIRGLFRPFLHKGTTFWANGQ